MDWITIAAAAALLVATHCAAYFAGGARENAFARRLLERLKPTESEKPATP